MIKSLSLKLLVVYDQNPPKHRKLKIFSLVVSSLFNLCFYCGKLSSYCSCWVRSGQQLVCMWARCWRGILRAELKRYTSVNFQVHFLSLLCSFDLTYREEEVVVEEPPPAQLCVTGRALQWWATGVEVCLFITPLHDVCVKSPSSLCSIIHQIVKRNKFCHNIKYECNTNHKGGEKVKQHYMTDITWLLNRKLTQTFFKVYPEWIWSLVSRHISDRSYQVSGQCVLSRLDQTVLSNNSISYSSHSNNILNHSRWVV